ncbi:MAG TPA: DUF3267 domain-containing protein, partial [Anaerolineaceae bacterium]
MRPVDHLPEGYTAAGTLDLKQNLNVLLLLNLVGAGLLVLSGWLMIRAAFWLRPAGAGQGITLQVSDPIGGLKLALAALAILAVMLVLHEAIHGLFFWIFTRARPVFGAGPGYAYAAAPGWYLPRDQYLMVGLAPLVVITLLGLAALAWVSPGWVMTVIAFVAFNASGAVGDLAVA